MFKYTAISVGVGGKISRKLACYYNNSAPDQLMQQRVADYLLYLINDRAFAFRSCAF